jgi:hypothetical protein
MILPEHWESMTKFYVWSFTYFGVFTRKRHKGG